MPLINLSDEYLVELCSTFNFSQPGAHQLDFHVHHEKPDTFTVWALGLTFVTIVSISAVLGIFFMQCMNKQVFNRFITFFVAVGVGTLSGSSIFHLLPQAFGLVIEFETGANHDYLWKAFGAACGIYIFFIADKLIKLFLEARKRRGKDYELRRLSPSLDGPAHSHDETDSISQSQSNSRIFQSDSVALDKDISNPDTVTTNGEMRQTHSICVHDHDVDYKTGDSVIGTVAWMIIFGDGLHNFIDGVSIGASFSESLWSGLSVSVAVICEEFPHELGDVAILVSAGMTLRQALIYNVLSALTCYVGFFIGATFGNLSDSFASYIFSFSGGMFLYISIGCMMPEMKITMEKAIESSVLAGVKVLLLQLCGIFMGLALMVIMARYGGEISFAST